MMACRTVLRAIFLSEPWCPFPGPNPASILPYHALRSSFGIRVRVLHGIAPLRCSHGETSSQTSPSASTQADQEAPQEVVLKAISEASKSEGRVAQTRNVVIGGTVSDDSTNEWLSLDQKVNSYPTVRGFTAIGTGGDDFVQAMIVAVESVLQQSIPEVRVDSFNEQVELLDLNMTQARLSRR